MSEYHILCYLMFSEICIPIFSKWLLKYVVFTSLILNHSIKNYYVVTFVLERVSLKTETDHIPATQYVKFQYVLWKSPQSQKVQMYNDA
jgi:hypothetical protein